MHKTPLLTWMIVLVCFTLTPLYADATVSMIDEIMPTVISNHEYPKLINDRLFNIKTMLLREGSTLHREVMNKVMSVLICTERYDLNHDNILSIIDYSLSSHEKRLWVFDINNQKLLFNTYVSHGIKSGVLLSNHFSNKYDSKASSIGVYKTDKSYYGRHGLSLKLNGLDYGFNDNADGRAIVMHGGWYVNERFIKKYGRSGRSWGCPAVPSELTESIINTIKNNSLVVAYYPSDRWFVKSRFLKCDDYPSTHDGSHADQSIDEIEQRDEILFVDRHNTHQLTDNSPVIAISSDSYHHLFHAKAPLTRMLRRQINGLEYIALNRSEFQHISRHEGSDMADNDKKIYLVAADIRMVRGYSATEMKIVDSGTITSIQWDQNSQDVIKNGHRYTVCFDANRSMIIRESKRFVRWIGL